MEDESPAEHHRPCHTGWHLRQIAGPRVKDGFNVAWSKLQALVRYGESLKISQPCSEK